MTTAYTIITGALGGLGSTFAYECASRSTNLILVDRVASGDPLQGFLSENFSVDIQYHSCDLADQTARTRLFQDLEGAGKHFNGLINVVGQELEGPFLTRTREEALYMLHLNIEAMVDLSLFALNRHTPAEKFMLINVASLAGFFPIPHKAVYASSKRFIIQFSLALREEVRDFASVTVLCPGGLPTNPEAMKKIFLQGFWGKVTAHDTHQVVKRTLKKARRNRPVYTPGLANQFLLGMAKWLPPHWVASYTAGRWGGKQSQLDYWRLQQKKYQDET